MNTLSARGKTIGEPSKHTQVYLCYNACNCGLYKCSVMYSHRIGRGENNFKGNLLFQYYAYIIIITWCHAAVVNLY